MQVPPKKDRSRQTLNLDLAMALLTTPPPHVSPDMAKAAAWVQFGWNAECAPMSGERDRNFLLSVPGKQFRVTLKFINAAESEPETDLQVAVLRHLAASHAQVSTPVALTTLRGQAVFDVSTPSGSVRARAYSYLEGAPANLVSGTPELRFAIGRAAAELDVALAGFEHPAPSRIFLWDLMQLAHLRPLVRELPDDGQRGFIEEFLSAFEEEIEPSLAQLPLQVIHGDLSKSNLLVDPLDPTRLAGVLDFGDMVHAPAVADLAVAASYQMTDCADPIAALSEVVAGYESVRMLAPAERRHLLDLIIARLVQRIVITEWRAARFPENRNYILRSNPDARRLLGLLMMIWRATFPDGLPKSTFSTGRK